MQWEIVDTGKSSAGRNMQIDADLLKNAPAHPVLHFYDWESPYSLTYGHFIEPSQFLRLQSGSRWNLDLAKRPTGGGITFHQTDFAFSVFIPACHHGYHLNVLENYAFINHRIVNALHSLLGERAFSLLAEETKNDDQSRHFCLAKPTQYDVMAGGRKMGGGAQRRTKEGFLHQGSISLAMPDESFLKDILLPDSKVLACIRHNSYYPFESHRLDEARQTLKKALAKFLID